MKENKIIIISLIIVLIFLFINMASTIWTTIDYQHGKESGNERWKQVENRILETEEKVRLLEEEFEQWKR